MKDSVEDAVKERAEGKPLGKRERTKINNREAILQAARNVFADLGYGATTVRDIIRRTGLASGTFYNYFRSKEEVFEALMDEGMRRIRPRLRAERIRSRTFEDFIRNALHAYFEYLASDRETFEVMRRNPNTVRVRMETAEMIAGFEEIREYMEEDIRNGTLPPVDSEYLMASVVGLAMEMGDRMIARDNVDPAAAAEFATALVLGGFHNLPVAGTAPATSGADDRKEDGK
ncbi:TetR/AcrR family transcriptional regulator [Parvibaculum sp. MBR-TMA-1.3b-4.2]|jgi:AcrR family transcriptional regulator